ncbi:MAG TPA: nucleotidyltransferase family protein [Terriglobia bacterium]|nr:nucleotidyltransferase family protein [Terriglobia bacterium]
MNLKIMRAILKSLENGDVRCHSQKSLRELRPPEWKLTLGWLRRSGLALYWWSRIKAGNNDGFIPRNIREDLDADLRENRARLSAMAGEFRLLILLLRGAEIPYAVLKGFALIPEYCPDPVFRNQYDFDFLVRPDSLGRLNEVLLDSGFIKKPKRIGDNQVVYFESTRQPQVPHNLDKVFSPDLYRPIEIHTCLWQASVEKIHFELPPDPLGGVVLKTWNDLSFFSLAPEEALVFQVIHLFRHILNNYCRLSHFFELTVFLHQHAEQKSFWTGFERVVQADPRLMEAAGVVFSLAANLFNLEVPGHAKPFTTDHLTSASAFWVHEYGLQSALQNFTNSKSSLYLHRLFVEKECDWKKIRRRRLFPIQKPGVVARASSRATMPNLGAHSRQLMHILRRSWFHGVAALKYVWGLPEWRRASRTGVGGINSKRADRAAMATGTMRGE